MQVRNYATVGQLVITEKGKDIEFNDSLVEAINIQPNDNTLFIFHRETKVIRVITLQIHIVEKIVVTINKLLPDFIGLLGSIFIKNSMNILYSSALCFYKDKCVYEGYLDPGSVNLSKIKNEVLGIFGVNDVKFEKIHV